MEINYSLETNDLIEAIKFKNDNIKSVINRKFHRYIISSILIILIIISIIHNVFQWYYFLGLIVLIPSEQIVPRISMLLYKDTYSKISLNISSESIILSRGGKSGNIPWQNVDSLVEQGNNLYIRCRNGKFITIPKRIFENDENKLSFIDTINSNLKNDA